MKCLQIFFFHVLRIAGPKQKNYETSEIRYIHVKPGKARLSHIEEKTNNICKQEYILKGSA